MNDYSSRKCCHKNSMSMMNNNMNIDNLYVSTTFVDAGPIMKRIHPRSRGQAFGIMKRTSTLTVKVSERN